METSYLISILTSGVWRKEFFKPGKLFCLAWEWQVKLGPGWTFRKLDSSTHNHNNNNNNNSNNSNSNSNSNNNNNNSWRRHLQKNYISLHNTCWCIGIPIWGHENPYGNRGSILQSPVYIYTHMYDPSKNKSKAFLDCSIFPTTWERSSRTLLGLTNKSPNLWSKTGYPIYHMPMCHLTTTILTICPCYCDLLCLEAMYSDSQICQKHC